VIELGERGFSLVKHGERLVETACPYQKLKFG
jgi:hypothetical protein